MKKKYLILLIPFLLLTAIWSCNKRQFVQGRAEVVSVTDTFLHDSSLVYGNVYRVDWVGNYHYIDGEFEVWIENTALKTATDTSGAYAIKTVAGTYTVRCQEALNEWDRLIEGLKDFDLAKNKSVQIDFYIGYTIE